MPWNVYNITSSIDQANSVRLEIGDYSRDKDLIIDPTLIYSTYIGGGYNNYGASIVVDGSGNAYVAGWTDSSIYPTTPGAYDTSHNGAWDVFITKIDPTGQSLVYSTYLGGGGEDWCNGIAIDSGGNAYVTGYTYSSDFPTNAYDTSFNGGRQDGFVAKIDPTGQSLVYSTFLGGNGGERGYGITVDSAGNAYVTGWNWYGDFPTTPGAFDTSPNGGDSDVFITKINSTGRSLIYSTYLGASGGDRGYGIVIDGSENAYITGWTSSTDFPTTPGAYDTSFNGNWDVFITKINPSGTALFYSTYLGGNGRDHVYGIAVDRRGNAYVAGWTNSTNFPTTPDAYDTSDNEDGDGFVSKISRNGQGLSYSTYLGGRSVDYVSSIAVDRSGKIYVTGYTVSNDFPTTPGAYNTYLNAGPDVFVTVFVSTLDTVQDVTENVVTALERDVYFIYPDLGHAAATDWSALGAIYGMTANSQNIGLDSWSALIDQTTGRLIVPAGKKVITIGSAWVNFAVRYYENRAHGNFWNPGTTPVYDQAYVRMNLDGQGSTNHIWFETSSRASMPNAVIWNSVLHLGDLRGGNVDEFVVQSFTDGDNRQVLTVYGLGWKGSWISSIYLKELKATGFDTLINHWMIVKWTDGNGDLLPQLDELSVVASGD